MDDRELLELAAKASGIGLHVFYGDDYYPRPWDPLNNDGEAFRLAVKLNFQFFISGADNENGEYVPMHAVCEGEEEKIKGDPYAATRRAIVCAAAKIGRSMK